MPVIDTQRNPEALTLTITAEFAAPPQRIWDIYAHPRQLEQVWGPPTHPATVIDHDLRPGGRITYYMTGPEGDRHYGTLEVVAAEEPHSFRYVDVFTDESFQPNPDLPTSHCTASFTGADGGTRAVYVTTYDSLASLQTVLDMGVEEGTTAALAQIDDLVR